MTDDPRIWRRQLSRPELFRRARAICAFMRGEVPPPPPEGNTPCPVIELYPQHECDVCALVGQACCRRHQGELK